MAPAFIYYAPAAHDFDGLPLSFVAAMRPDLSARLVIPLVVLRNEGFQSAIYEMVWTPTF